jgi:hypothetical protein
VITNDPAYTSIPDEAFQDCVGITSVTMGSNIVSIGTSAFQRCSAMSSVELPTSLTFIGEAAFASSGLLSVALPTSMVTLERFVFSSCGALSSITLPLSVNAIGDFAFGDNINNTPPCNSNAATLFVPVDMPQSVYSAVQYDCAVVCYDAGGAVTCSV